MDEMNEVINERIKKRRLACELTVSEVAEASGLSRATIYRYESGEIKSIGSDKIELLAEALNTTPDYLMGWTDDPINYDDPDLAAEISTDVLDYFNGDVEKCLKFMAARDEDAARGFQDNVVDLFTARNETERKVLFLARQAEDLSEEQKQKIVDYFEQTIELYLEAIKSKKKEDE